MVSRIDSSDTAEAEGEGPEGSDCKPPHNDLYTKSSTQTNGNKKTAAPASMAQQSSIAQSNGQNGPNGVKVIDYQYQQPQPNLSVPLPPPESGAMPKEPGHTKRSLSSLFESQKPAYAAPPMLAIATSSGSDSDGWSANAASQAPSRASSRAPSMSQGKSGSKILPNIQQDHGNEKSTKLQTLSPQVDRSSSTTAKPKGDTASLQSYGEGQKFTLKELLANGPKLTRKSSVRSTASSKKSDSDGKSTAAESTGSLLKKYGVCGRVAIGKGATSVVRLAHKWDRTEEKLYAVKEFRKRRKNETEKEYVKKLTAEFCISSTLHHTNIVETVDLVQDENQHWCEVMEYCPGGDLYAAIKKGGMSGAETECCFKQILNGIAYLHSQGVAHRDIKPENLFFDARGQLKIGDYGASTVYRLPWESTVHMSTGLCGSEPYIAPEQFTMKPYDARLVDIWACGIVFYCLQFQELPWRVAQMSDPLYAAYATACASTSSSPNNFAPTISNLSPRNCRPVIRRMLDPDPKTRWPIEDIIAHPWVQSIEVCHMVAKPTHVHTHATTLAHQPPA